VRQLGQQGVSGLTGVSRHGGLRWAVGNHRQIKGSGNIKGNINFGNINPLWVNLLVLPSTSPVLDLQPRCKNHSELEFPRRTGESRATYGPLAVWAFYVDDTAFVLNVFYKK
jgi:hypothetical protein